VKHTGLESQMRDYLSLMGIQPSSDQCALLAYHIELVLEVNKRVNLTRITDPIDAVRRHTGDSLSVLEDVQCSPDGVMLDLGTGAGFPGIPLAIFEDRPVVLLDSVGKKIRELGLIVSALGLNARVSTVAGRAEALARSRPRSFAVVAARAVSELPALVELASPLLVADGRLLCLKGSPSLDEISRANIVAIRVGMKLEYQRGFAMPEQVGHRTVLCYRKTGASSVPLPRREGMAQHAPLA